MSVRMLPGVGYSNKLVQALKHGGTLRGIPKADRALFQEVKIPLAGGANMTESATGVLTSVGVLPRDSYTFASGAVKTLVTSM